MLTGYDLVTRNSASARSGDLTSVLCNPFPLRCGTAAELVDWSNGEMVVERKRVYVCHGHKFDVLFWSTTPIFVVSSQPVLSFVKVI